MINLFFVLSLFITQFFFTLLPIFGLNYYGKEGSPVYVISVLVVNVITVIYIVIYELKNHHNAQGSVMPYLLPFLWLFLYTLDLAIYDDMGQESSHIVVFFISSTISCILLGNFVYRYDLILGIIKWIEPLAIMASIGLLISVPSFYLEQSWDSHIGGGGGHQTISYTAAFLVAYFWINVSLGLPACRLKVFKKTLFSIIEIILIFTNAIICIIGGGRGGVVLLIVNVFLCLWYLYRKHFLKLSLLIAFVLAVLLLVNKLWPIDSPVLGMIQTGFDRSFSFVSSDGIDMSETSNRDIVYSRAWDLISASPINGYGFFHQYDICRKFFDQPYSHNLFLELLLQGGILYCIGWVVLLIKFVLKTHFLFRNQSHSLYLLPMITFPLVMVMFSGSYVVLGLFWFDIIFVLSITKSKLNSFP